MTSVNSSYTRNSVNTFPLRYWPAFEVTAYALPQEKAQELYYVLNKFVSGLETYSKLESREPRCRPARSLSCPLMGSRTVPFAPSTTDSSASQRSPDLPQMQQSTFQDDHIQFAPSLSRESHPYNQKDSWRKPLGQEESPDTPQNIQVTPCDAPIRLLNQRFVDVSLNDSHKNNEVTEDNDSSASIDFLATLRQLDPQRALELERQYDANIAELRQDDKREAVSKNTTTKHASL